MSRLPGPLAQDRSQMASRDHSGSSPVEPGRTASAFRMIAVYDTARECILSVQRHLLLDKAFNVEEARKQIAQCINTLRAKQIAETTLVAQEIDDHTRSNKETRRRMAEIGLDQRQIAYVCQLSGPPPSRMPEKSGIGSMPTDNAAHQKLSEVLEGIGCPNAGQIAWQPVNIICEQINAALRDALTQKLKREEQEEQVKLGVMSHEYEKKIVRLIGEENKIEGKLLGRVSAIEEINKQLSADLNSAMNTIQGLNAQLGQKDIQLRQMMNTPAMSRAESRDPLRGSSSGIVVSHIVGRSPGPNPELRSTMPELQRPPKQPSSSDSQVLMLQQEINRLQNVISQKETEARRFASDLQHVRDTFGQQLTSLDGEKRYRDEQIGSLNHTISLQEQEIRRLSSELSSLQAQLNNIQSSNHQENTMFQQDYRNLQLALQEKEQEVQRLNNELGRVKESLNSLEAQMYTENSKRSATEEESRRLLIHLQDSLANEKIASQRWKEAAEDKTTLVQRMQDDLNKLNGRCYGFEQELLSKQNEISSYKSLLEQLNVRYKESIDQTTRIVSLKHELSVQTSPTKTPRNTALEAELDILRKKVSDLEKANQNLVQAQISKSIEVQIREIQNQSVQSSGVANQEESREHNSSIYDSESKGARKRSSIGGELYERLSSDVVRVIKLQNEGGYGPQTQEDLENSLQKLSESCSQIMEGKKLSAELKKEIDRLAQVAKSVAGILHSDRVGTPIGLSRFKSIEPSTPKKEIKDEAFVQRAGEEALAWEKITDLENENRGLKQKIAGYKEQLITRNSNEAQQFAKDYNFMVGQVKQLQNEKLIIQQNLQNVIVQANTQLTTLNVQLEQSDKARLNLQHTVESINQHLHDNEEQMATLKSIIESEAAATETLKTQYKQALAKIEEDSRSNRMLQVNLQAAEKNISELKQRIVSVEEEASGRLRATQSQLAAQASSQVEVLQAKINEIAFKLNSEEGKRGDLEKKSEELQNQINNLKNINNQLEEKLKSTRTEADSATSAVSIIEQRLKSAKQSNEELQKKLTLTNGLLASAKASTEKQTTQIERLNARVAELEHETNEIQAKSQHSTNSYLHKISELSYRIAELETKPQTPLQHHVDPIETTKQVDMLVYSISKANELQKEPATPQNQQDMDVLLQQVNQISLNLGRNAVLPHEVLRDLKRVSMLTQKVTQGGPRQDQNSNRQIKELSLTVDHLKKELSEKQEEEKTIAELIQRIKGLQNENEELNRVVKELSVLKATPASPAPLQQGFSDSNPDTAKMLHEINDLQRQMRVATGKIEEKERQLEIQKEELLAYKKSQETSEGTLKDAILEANKGHQENTLLKQQMSDLEIEIKTLKIQLEKYQQPHEDEEVNKKIYDIASQVTKVHDQIKTPSTPAIQREIRTQLRTISDLCQDISLGNRVGPTVSEKLTQIKDILTGGEQLPEEKYLPDQSVSNFSGNPDQRLNDVKTLVGQIQAIQVKQKEEASPMITKSQIMSSPREQPDASRENELKEVIRRLEATLKKREAKISSLREHIESLETKINQLEENLYFSGQPSRPPPSRTEMGMMGQMTIQPQEANFYMAEINRLTSIASQYEASAHQQQASIHHFVEQMSDLNRKIYELEQSKASSHTKNAALKEQLAAASSRLQELEMRLTGADTVPRAALKAECQIYLNQISTLTKRLSETESRLKQLSALRNDKSLDIGDEPQKSRPVALVAEDTRKHLVQVASMAKKLRELENVPAGVPKQEVQKHIMMIIELSKRMQASENKLRDQTMRLSTVQKDEQEIITQILRLSSRINELESQEDSSAGDKNDRLEKISNFKRMLEDSLERLNKDIKMIESLEEENIGDMKFIRKSIRDANKHLVQIGVLAQMGKELGSVTRGASQEQVNDYLSVISVLTSRLSQSEHLIAEQNSNLVVSEQSERIHQRKLLELSRQIRNLEDNETQYEDEDDKERQLRDIKAKFESTLRAMQIQNEDSLPNSASSSARKSVRDSPMMVMPRHLQATESLGHLPNDGEQHRVLQQKVQELESQLKRDAEKITELTRRLSESEDMLKQQSQIVKEKNMALKEESQLKDQVSVLSKRVKELEEHERISESMTYEHRTELDQMRKLYEETSLKYQEVQLSNSAVQTELQNEIAKLAADRNQSTSEISDLRRKLKELEVLPKGIPQEEVQKHVAKISDLSKKLTEAELRSKVQAEVLTSLQKEEKEHMSLLMLLTDKIKDIEKDIQTPGRQVTQQQKDVERYKTILDKTAEKIRKLGQQNMEMEQARSQEKIEMEKQLAEANTHLQQIAMLSNKVKQLESEPKGVPQTEVEKFVKSIKELTDRLTQTEADRREKEAKLDATEIQDRQHQQQILELTEKIRAIENEEKKIQGMASQKTEELELNKQKLEETMAKLQKQNADLNYLAEQKNLADIQAKRSFEQSEKFAKEISELQNRLSELNQAPKGVPQSEVDVMVKRMSELNSQVSLLESKNNKLSEQLADTQNEYKNLKDLVNELQAKSMELENGERQYEHLARDRQSEIDKYKVLLQQANSTLQSEISTNKQLQESNNQSLQVLTSTQTETKTLQEKVASLQRRVNELESAPKGPSQEEVKQYTDRITEMNARIAQLESKLSARELEVTKIAAEERLQSEKVRALAARIELLEKAETQTKEGLNAKEAELSQLRKLHRETTDKLQETILMNRHLDEENHRESEQILKLSDLNGLHIHEITELRAKLEQLQDIPQGVPQEVFREKVSQVSDLSRQLSQAEITIRSQAEKLSKAQSEEKEHGNLIMVLAETLEKLERQEKLGLEGKAQEVTSVKKSLDEATRRMEQLSAQNRELESLHKNDQDALAQSLAQVNTQLMEIGNLTQQVRQLDQYSKEVNEKQIKDYAKMVSELTDRLSRSEVSLRERSTKLNELEAQERAHHTQIIGLVKKVGDVEKQGQQSHLEETKQQLNEAVSALKHTRVQNIKDQNQTSQDSKHLEKFEFDTKKTLDQLARIIKKVGTQGKLSQNSHEEDQEEVQKYLAQISMLSARSQEVETLLKVKEQEMASSQSIDKEHFKYIEILLDRIKELEGNQSIAESTILTRNKELDFYKTLLSDTTKKIEGLKIDIPVFESQVHHESSIPSDKTSKRVSLILQHARALDTIPEGVSEDEAHKYLSLVYSMESQLEQAEQKIREQDTRMSRLQDEKRRQVNEIIFLSDKISSLEREEPQEEQEIQSRNQKLSNLKGMLDDTTRRLQATLTENSMLQQSNRRFMSDVQILSQESASHLSSIADLVRKVNANEAQSQVDDQDRQEYLQNIAELTDKLQMSSELFQLEAVKLEELCNENKQFSSDIDRLTKEIRRLESKDLSKPTKTTEGTAEVVDLRKSLTDTLKKVQTQSMVISKLQKVYKDSTRNKELSQAQAKAATLQKRVEELEQQVATYAAKLGESHVSEDHLRSKFDTLTDRIRDLEREEEQSEALSPSKKSELSMYRIMKEDSRKQLQQAIQSREELEKRLVHEAEKAARLEASSNQQKIQISMLTKRVKELSTTPLGVPVEVFQEKLQLVNELTQKLQEADERLRAQTNILGNAKKEEKSHFNQIILLNDRIRELEVTEAAEEHEIKEKNEKIAQYKLMIDQATSRIGTLTREYLELEDEFKNRQNSLDLALKDAGLHIKQLNTLAVAESTQKAATNKEEMAKYVSTINDLNDRLSRVQEETMKAKSKLTSTHQHEQQLEQEVLELTKKIRLLESDDKDIIGAVSLQTEELTRTQDQLQKAIAKIKELSSVGQGTSKQSEIIAALSSRVKSLEAELLSREEEDIKSKAEYIELVEELNEKLLEVESQTNVSSLRESGEHSAVQNSQILAHEVKRLSELHSEQQTPDVVKERQDIVEHIDQLCKNLIDSRPGDYEAERILQALHLLATRVQEDNHRQSGRRLAELITQTIKIQRLVRRGMSPDIRKKKRLVERNQARDEENRAKQVDQLLHKIKELEVLVSTKEDEIRKSRERVDALSIKLKEADLELVRVQRNQLNIYISQLNIQATRIAELEAQLTMRPDLWHVQSQIQQQNFKAAVDQTSQLTSRLLEAEQINYTLKQTSDYYLEKIEKLELRLHEANLAVKQKAALQDSIERLSKDNDRLREERGRLEVHIEQVITDYERKISSKEIQLDKTKSSNFALQQDLETLRKQVTMFLQAQAAQISSPISSGQDRAQPRRDKGSTWLGEQVVILQDDLQTPQSRNLVESYIIPESEEHSSSRKQDEDSEVKTAVLPATIHTKSPMVTYRSSPQSTPEAINRQNLQNEAEALLGPRTHQGVSTDFHSHTLRSPNQYSPGEFHSQVEEATPESTRRDRLRNEAEVLLGPRTHHAASAELHPNTLRTPDQNDSTGFGSMTDNRSSRG